MRLLLRHLLTLSGAVLVYFTVPTGELPSSWSAVLSILGLVGGGLLLAVLIVQQLRRHLTSGEEDSVRIQTLLTLLYLSVLGFALGYYVLATSTDHQFAGMHTRIDALYFTVVTAATVGYGDVHPTGQLARALVTGQVVFNLVFLGLLVSLMTTQVRERVATRRDQISRGS